MTILSAELQIALIGILSLTLGIIIFIIRINKSIIRPIAMS